MESELERFRQKKRVEKYKSQLRLNIETWWFKLTNTITQAILPDKDNDDDESEENEDHETQDKEVASSNKSSITKREGRNNNRKHLNSNSNHNYDDQKTTQEINNSSDNDTSSSPYIFYITLSCKILIWICLFMGFVKLELGAIFFIISVFWFIWINTSTSNKKKKATTGAPSAYSVFNPHCESIDGTLKAEQLEKQLLFRETK